MAKINIIMLSCSQAAEYCDKEEYKEAAFLSKLKLKLHLFFCANCRKYQEKNKKLSLLLKEADLKTCSSLEKKALKERLENSQNLKKED